MQSTDPTPTSPARTGAPDGPEEVLFEERLTPALWIWAVALMFAGLSVLVFAPISMATGIVAAVIVFAVEAVLLIGSTPRIVLTDRTLTAGRATIERHHLGRATGHRGELARRQRGPLLHGLAYLNLRPWIDPVVRVQITDERDRTPYWLLSTRRPEELVGLLGGRMEAGEDSAA